REVLRVYRGYRAESHKGGHGSFAYVSDACFDAAVHGLMRSTVAFNVIGKVLQISAKPVFLAPQPAISDAILTAASHGGGAVMQAAMNAGDDRALAESFYRVSRLVESSRLNVLDQPPETMSSPLLTMSKYQVGAAHMLDQIRAGRDDDIMHMNG